MNLLAIGAVSEGGFLASIDNVHTSHMPQIAYVSDGVFATGVGMCCVRYKSNHQPRQLERTVSYRLCNNQ